MIRADSNIVAIAFLAVSTPAFAQGEAAPANPPADTKPAGAGGGAPDGGLEETKKKYQEDEKPRKTDSSLIVILRFFLMLLSGRGELR